jgi:hypothetical protein
VTHFFWLGIDALPPEADEDAQYTVTDNPDGGFTAEPIEADGFITIHPKLIQTPPSH